MDNPSKKEELAPDSAPIPPQYYTVSAYRKQLQVGIAN